MTRYVLVAPLAPLAVDDGFTVSAWPLHVTIVGNFATDLPLIDIAALLETNAPAQDVVVGREDLFGPHHNVAVSVILPSGWLTSLHEELVGRVAAAGARFDTPEYLRAGFRPHVTATKRAGVAEGDILHLDQLALVDMAPHGDRGVRRVVWTRSLA